MSVLAGPKPDLSKMELAQLKVIAQGLGIEVPPKATKAQLAGLIERKV